MLVEKQMLVPVYVSNWCIQSWKGRSCIHQCSVPQWLVTMSIIILMPLSWAFDTSSR